MDIIETLKKLAEYVALADAREQKKTGRDFWAYANMIYHDITGEDHKHFVETRDTIE